MNARTLSEFNHILKNPLKQAEYQKISDQMLLSITEVFWQEHPGTWLDYDLVNNKRRNYFSCSNLIPLWTRSYQADRKADIARFTLEYLNASGILNFSGGIPTTMEQTGEQWDFPNAWPPFQHMVIMGLEYTGEKEAQEVAYNIASKWIQSNYMGWTMSGTMFEKVSTNE